MRQMALSLAFCCVLAALALWLCARASVPLAITEWLVIAPLIALVPVYEFLVRNVEYRSSSLSYLKAYSFDRHTYDWRFLAPYLVLCFAVSTFLCGYVSGVLARTILGTGYDADLYIGPASNTIAMVLVTLVTIWIGIWIGERARRRGLWVVGAVVIFGPLFGRLSEMLQLDDATFKLIHSGVSPDLKYFYMSSLFNLLEIGIPMLMAFGIGYARRDASYVSRVLALTPKGRRHPLIREVHGLAVQALEYPPT